MLLDFLVTLYLVNNYNSEKFPIFCVKKYDVSEDSPRQEKIHLESTVTFEVFVTTKASKPILSNCFES